MNTGPREQTSESFVRRWAPLVLIAAAMIGLKTALLAAETVPFNGDEAIIALMARHIGAGGRPAFFYGQAYLGSTDAWLISVAFSIFGESVLSIRLVQTLLFAATLFTAYPVARRLGLSVWAARLAVLLLALPPTMLTLYTTATLGGYGETLLLGNLLILSAYSIPFSAASTDRATLFRWASFGLLAGFAFWTFGLILVYLIPVSVWLLHRHRLSARGGYVVAALGFVIGSAPWWTAIGNLGGSLVGELAGAAVANTVAGSTLLGSLGVRLINFFWFGLSAWFGVRYPWSAELVLPWAGILILVVYVGAFVFALRRGSRLMWGMIGVLLLTYLLTPFGGDPSGRYFVSLYLPLAVFAATWIERLRSRMSGGSGRGFVGLLVLFVLGYNLAGTALATQQPHGITTQFDRVTWIERGHEQELIDSLLAHGETRGYTNYWVAYPVAFLSDERIIGVPRLPYHLDLDYAPRDDRYLPYAQAVAESPRVFYITTNHPPLDARIRKGLTDLGVTFNEETIGSYHVFYALSRKVEPEELRLGK